MSLLLLPNMVWQYYYIYSVFCRQSCFGLSPMASDHCVWFTGDRRTARCVPTASGYCRKEV